MPDIGRKIYYEKLTGNIIQDTGERSGSVVETTQAEDFQLYAALAERVPETVGCLQLEYGQDQESFMRCTGYRVDLETLKVVFYFRDPQEPEEPPVYEPSLTEQVKELQNQLDAANEQSLDTMGALADVFEMVLSLQDQIAGGGAV